MTITDIEKEFAKVGSPWIPRIHSFLEKNDDIPEDKFNDNLYKYTSCFVGDMRERLGLPDDYYYESDDTPKNYCFYCTNTAGSIYSDVIYTRDQPSYLLDLVRFKKHLKEAHSKEI